EWREIFEDYVEDLVDEAYKRAKGGSDSLLRFLLESYEPESYKFHVKPLNPMLELSREQVEAMDDKSLMRLYNKLGGASREKIIREEEALRGIAPPQKRRNERYGEE
ncbi:MAG TPA: hypothetical protein VFJ29_01280, partial [Candidatus Kapabacteria bacterium]|nr:hypothetical protein [Candidatus Kapabacteria bacterium]